MNDGNEWSDRKVTKVKELKDLAKVIEKGKFGTKVRVLESIRELVFATME